MEHLGEDAASGPGGSHESESNDQDGPSPAQLGRHQGSFLPPGACSGPGGGGGGGRGCHVDISTVTPVPPLPHHPTLPPEVPRYYCWVPASVSPPPWPCQVCPQHFANVESLATHFHQYHLNPHHLSPEDRRKYRLSNFLVNKNEEIENKTDFPGLYRCHECFNVFSFPISLREHLEKHLQEQKTMVVSKLSSKFSREDFEDVSPRKRSRKSYKENKCESNEDICSPEKMNNNLNGHTRLRTRLKNTKKFVDFCSDPSDEFNSDSDYEGEKVPLGKRVKRKFRDSKSRKVSSKRFSLNGFSDVDNSKAFFDPDDELFEEDLKRKRKTRLKRNSSKKHSKIKVSESNDTSVSEVPEVAEPAPKTKDKNTSNVARVVRRNPKQDKKWRFKIVDHSKMHSVVEQITNPPSDFLCLRCNQSFSSFSSLSHHKTICGSRKNTSLINVANDSKNLNKVKHETVIDSSSAVTAVPETSFNSMHGKIVDLKTEDAQKFSQNHLNEIGLVKLNFSGNWSVKDAWESGCWEPKDDQLTWQEYELSSEIAKMTNTRNDQLSDAASKEQETDITAALAEAPLEADNDEVHKLTENLTTQIVGRKAPIITNPGMDRRMVMAMSRIPWTEQRFVKQRIDSNLSVKRNKRMSVAGESIRQSNITSLLDLKQTGKSVKYMKQVERESLAKTRSEDGVQAEVMVSGSLSGEWELGHSYMCSVCAVEYDDMMEILHHKWESHPQCLVSHLSVRDNVTKPPDLMYPQVGPSTVNRDVENNSKEFLSLITCSKCGQEFESNDAGRTAFHHHVLECGGVADAVETGKRKKKKKRGMGGGLKSTVRMLKKSENDKDGTDNEEQSPKKRVRSTPKVVTPVPLVPLHKRSTRYKETMKKEAKKIAARERRIKKKRGKTGGDEDDEEVELKSIVADVLDTVLADVQMFRRKPSRSRALRSSVNSPRKENTPSMPLNSSKREVRTPQKTESSRKRRENKIKTYKENSSDTDGDEETNIDKVKEGSENVDNAANADTSTALKVVVVTVANDEDLSALMDISKGSAEAEVAAPADLSVAAESPRILKRLESTLVADSSIAARNEEERRARQQFSVEAKMTAISRMEAGDLQEDIARELDTSASMLESWWIRRSDIKAKYLNILANGIHDTVVGEANATKNARSRSRSLDLKPVDINVKVNAINNIINGTSPKKVAKELGLSPSQVNLWWRRKDLILKRNKRLSLGAGVSEKDYSDDTEKENPSKTRVSGKKSYSLEFKRKVISRIMDGEEISVVAKNLKIRENTVSVWWIRRDQILSQSSRPPITVEERKVDTKDVENMKVKSELNVGEEENKSDDQQENDKTHISDVDKPPRSRRSAGLSARSPAPVVTSRWCMPLEVKQGAVRRLEAGVTQATVARDLDVSLSTVASWWRKKDSILGPSPDTNPSERVLDVKEDEVVSEETATVTTLPTTKEVEPRKIDDLGVSELEQLMTDDSEAETKCSEAEEDCVNHSSAESTCVPGNLNTSDLDAYTGVDLNNMTEESGGTAHVLDTNLKVEDTNSTNNSNPADNEFKDVTIQIPEDTPLTTPRPQSVSSLISPRPQSVTSLPSPRPPSVTSLTSTPTPRPQSGLQLIVANYCSSDEEL